MIWIISGPSCAGKSFFIESGAVTQFTDLPASIPTFFPGNVDFAQDFQTSFFYHYNILRPYRMRPKKWERTRIFAICQRLGLFQAKQSSSNLSALSTIYKKDLSWVRLANIKCPKKAIVLVTERQELLKRMMTRSVVENPFFVNDNIKIYPSEEWSEFLLGLKLLEVYQMWCKELSNQHIEYLLVDSTDTNYRIIESSNALEWII